MLIRDFEHDKTPIKYSVEKRQFFRAFARSSLTPGFPENSAIVNYIGYVVLLALILSRKRPNAFFTLNYWLLIKESAW